MMPLCEPFGVSEASVSYEPSQSPWFDRNLLIETRRPAAEVVRSTWVNTLLRTLWLSPPSAATITICFEALASLKDMGVRVPELSAIAMYLHRFPELLPTVEATTQKTLGVFLSNAHLSLEMVRDRESNDQYVALIVRMNTYPEDLFEHIDSINRAFDESRPPSDGWFYLTTDFQPPR